MKTLRLEGCWYVDATPARQFCAAVYGAPHVYTHLGKKDSPELQWVRISPDGERWAGTGAQSTHAWEWVGQEWIDRGEFRAPRAVIYTAQGHLFVERNAAWPGPGAQGWRYISDEGEMVPAWQTRDQHPARNIYEYTTRRDVTIGQGNGGVEAILPSKRVRLEALFNLPPDANCNAVNFNRQGDDYAISWYVAHSPTSYTACIVWLTDAELRDLPAYVEQPLPGPTEPPAPQPEPDPMPTTPDHSALVLKVDRQFPHLLKENSRESCGEFTERAVLELSRHDANWGHVGKRPGQTQYRGHAVDAVMYKATSQVIDIIGGAESHAPTRPIWLEVPNGGQPWMAPIEPEGGQGDPGDETDPPQPEPPKACDCAAELAKLRADLQQTIYNIGVVSGEHASEISKLQHVTAALTQEIAKPLRAKGRIKAKLSELLSRDGVPVDLEVVPE